MKYSWSNKRFLGSWIKQDIARLIYKYIYKFNVDIWEGTMLPKLGKGKYVSVYRKRDIIQIIDEDGDYDEIRLIPCQPNHGIMVERIGKDGKVKARLHMNNRFFNEYFKGLNNE